VKKRRRKVRASSKNTLINVRIPRLCSQYFVAPPPAPPVAPPDGGVVVSPPEGRGASSSPTFCFFLAAGEAFLYFSLCRLLKDD